MEIPEVRMRQLTPEVAGNSLPIWSFELSHRSFSPSKASGHPKLGQGEGASRGLMAEQEGEAGVWVLFAGLDITMG